MLKCVVVDCNPKVCQQTNTPFTLDRCPAYPANGPASRSALRLDRPSECVLLRINSGHLKCETTCKQTVIHTSGWWSCVLDSFQPAFSFACHHIKNPRVGLMHSTHALEDSPLRSPLFAISHLLRSGRNLCATSKDCSHWRESCAPHLKTVRAEEGRCLHVGLWSVKHL